MTNYKNYEILLEKYKVIDKTINRNLIILKKI